MARACAAIHRAGGRGRESTSSAVPISVSRAGAAPMEMTTAAWMASATGWSRPEPT